MNDDFMNWFLVVAVLSAVMTIVGLVTSRNLPEKQKKIRTQKFAAAGLALVFFCLPMFRPPVSSYSKAEYLDELEVPSIKSLEDVAKFNRKQADYIEDLRVDIKRLRDDLHSTNLFYTNAIQLLSFAGAMFILSSGFIKRKEDDLEEIQADQIPKL